MLTSVPAQDEVDVGAQSDVQSSVAHEVNQLNPLYHPHTRTRITLATEHIHMYIGIILV